MYLEAKRSRKLKIQIYTNLLSWMKSSFADCSKILFLETSLEMVLQKKKRIKGKTISYDFTEAARSCR